MSNHNLERGRGDYLSSHDLEGFVSVIDGRAEIVEEIRLAAQDVQSPIASRVGNSRIYRFASSGLILPARGASLTVGACGSNRRLASGDIANARQNDRIEVPLRA